MIINILLIILGLVILVKGADWLVNGSSALAKRYKISDLAIGLTIVAFGTSAPELVVSVISAVGGHSEIALGNVIGSNNFNLFLILGITGLITPIMVQSSTVWKEIPLSLIAALVLFALANLNPFLHSRIISHYDGMILFVLFLGFLFYVYKQLKSDGSDSELKAQNYSFTKIILFIAFGLSGLIFGGKLLVNSAVEIAKIAGISEKIIGLTIVAAGTSLPELVTSVVAAIKKNNDIAVGNIIGSNIFNIFLILSVSSFIKPISYNVLFNKDLIFLSFGTIFLFVAMFTGYKKKLDRWEAALLLFAYVVYLIYNIRFS